MARVFPTPIYRNQDYMGLFGLADDDLESALFGSLGMDSEFVATLVETADPENPEAVKEAKMAALHMWQTGRRSELPRMINLQHISKEMKKFCTSDKRRVVTGYEACVELWARLVSGEIEILPGVTKIAKEPEVMARELASAGMTASFATPSAAAEAPTRVKMYQELEAKYPLIARSMCLAESIRVATFSSSASDHLSEVLTGCTDLDIELLKMTDTGLSKWLDPEEVACYVVMGFLVLQTSETSYVLGRSSRSNLCDVLWSTGGWMLYGMNYQLSCRDPAVTQMGEKAAHMGVDYVCRAVLRRIQAGVRCDSLARSMKSSYAIVLARYGYPTAGEAERAIVDTQVPQLESEVDEARGPEPAWHDVIRHLPDDVQADLGTAWNLLPPPEADPALLDEALRAKLGAEHVHDSEAWGRFIRYCRGVISAHIILSHPDEDREWKGVEPGVDPEEQEWVLRCSRGVLTYPPLDSTMYLAGFFKWRRHLERWHHTAQDVTHVNSDPACYSDLEAMASNLRTDMNELLYVLQHGRLLSKHFDPTVVREAWENGRLPGDRVLLLAAKAENTKFGSKVRETASADDVLREVLTELDINISTLSRIIDGVATRAGRRFMEVRVGKLIAAVKEDALLLSLDVSGWSPNMDRRGEMEFVDMLMEFFDIPEKMKASAAFKDINVVLSKMGLHSKWKAVDGSIQGFFGTSDTILHSLMSQYAYRLGREKGIFEETAKLSKVALIDDILCAIRGSKITPEAAFNHFREVYMSLGFAADAVKTLLSSQKGHFLNRLYSRKENNAYEVITAAKIFAKADRSYEVTWQSCWMECDTIFGSYAGAADRGADPVVCYVMAMCRVLWRWSSIDRSLLRHGTMPVIFGAWIPRNLGGWGLPTYSSWETRGTTLTADGALSAPLVFARHFRKHDRVLSAAIQDLCLAASSQPLAERGPIAYCDDPFSPRVEGLPDPDGEIRALFAKAISKLKVCDEFETLFSSCKSNDYRALFRKVIDSHSMPAAVIAEWSSTMPHALVKSLTDKFHAFEDLLMRVPYATRRQARLKLREANRAALKFYLKTENRAVSSDMPTRSYSGSDMMLHIRQREKALIRSRLTQLALPSALDLVGMAAEESSTDIVVDIPKTEGSDIFSGPKVQSQRLARSYEVASMLGPEGGATRSLDPVIKSAMGMSLVNAMVTSAGGDPSVLQQAWTMAWLGSGVEVNLPVAHITGSNPFRLCSRTSPQTYTNIACPNYTPQVVVNASNIVHVLQNIPITFSMLSVVCSLKSATVLDKLLGGIGPKAAVRRYVLRGVGSAIREPPMFATDVDVELPHVRKALVDGQVNSMIVSLSKLGGIAEKVDRDSEDAPDGTLLISIVQPESVMSASRILKSRGAQGFTRALLVGAIQPSHSRKSAAEVAVSQAGYKADTGRREVDRVADHLLVIWRALESGKELIEVMRGKEQRHIDLQRDATSCGVGEVWARMLVPSGQEKAYRELIRLVMNPSGSLHKDPTSFWLNAASDHDQKALTYEGKFSYRSRFLAAAYRSWSLSYSQGGGWGDAFRAMISAISDSQKKIFSRVAIMDCLDLPAVFAELVLLLPRKGRWVFKYLEWSESKWPESWGDRGNLREGLKAALFRLDGQFLEDWLTRYADVERMTTSVRREGAGKAVVIPQLQMDRLNLGCLPDIVGMDESDELLIPEGHSETAWQAFLDHEFMRVSYSYRDAPADIRADYESYLETQMEESTAEV